MTVLPDWRPGLPYHPGPSIQIARAFKPGDKYLLSCRTEGTTTPVGAPSAKLVVLLQGL